MELAVGRIVKSHGVHGELVVEVRTDSPGERFEPGAVLIARADRGRGPARAVTVRSARSHAGRLLVRLAGIDSRDAADALRGTVLAVDSAGLAEPDDPDEFHDHQLIGLRVLDPTGTAVGVVTDIVHTPAGELLQVDTRSDPAAGPDADAAGDEVLVPFVSAIVPEVDLEAGTVTVDPPGGLWEAGGW